MKDSAKLRFVDQHIGRALCGVLSLPSLLHSKAAQMARGKIRKVLVIELFEMGAATMISPSLKYLQEQIPGAELYCLTTKTARESWEVLKLIPNENIFSIEGTGMFAFAFSAIKQILRLRKMRFDLVIDYELFFRASAILVALLKARWKAGFYKYQLEGLGRGNIYNIPCSFNQNQHIAKNFLALTKTAFEGRQDYPNFKNTVRNEELILPIYESDEKIRATLLTKLERFYPGIQKQRILVISPDVGPNLSVRNYPPNDFAAVIRDLLAINPDLVAVTVGTAGDSPTGDLINQLVGSPRAFSLCGQSSFRELLELLKMADVVLCNDNGVGHFASLTRTRTVALFSTDSPFVYGPLGPCTIVYSFFHCSPCISAFNHKNSKCRDNQCLKAISPAVVTEHVQLALERRSVVGTINQKTPYLL